MLTALQTRALTEPIDRRQYRDYEKRTRAAGRRLWPRVLGLLGTCAVIVFLSLYVTEWDLDRAPWFAIGIALLFALSWVLVRRATSKRQRLHYRLDQLARDNGWRLEHDVANPSTPGLLFGLGTKPVTVVRMTSLERPDEIEVGIHARTEATPAGTTAVVETLYVVAGASSASGASASASASSGAAASSSAAASGDPVAVTMGGGASALRSGLDDLPRAAVGFGENATSFSYEDLGDRTICYLAELLDLADPQTWVRISAVQAWIASPRP
jgi:hypothetical protein